MYVLFARRVIVGAPLRIGKHSLVGRTSITNAVQTPDFSNLGSSSINYFTTITMPSDAYIARERRFTKAIDALRNNEYPNVSVCARAKGISRRVLSDRWNGKASKSTRQAANKRLTEAQERTIIAYIERAN